MIYTVTLNPAIDRELLVPEIVFDTVLRAAGWQVDYGGKGFNVSRLLAGFDTPSTTLGLVGGDTGHILEKGLQAKRMGTVCSTAVEGGLLTRLRVAMTINKQDAAQRVAP